MSISVPLFLAVALVGPFKPDSVLQRDDFESEAERVGKPRIVKGVVSNGLLTPTQMGEYSTRSSLELPMREARPAPQGKFFRASFRLYSFNGSAELAWRFSRGADGVERKVLPRGNAERISAILPVDVEYVVAPDGDALCLVTSLADGTVIRTPCKDKFFAALGGREFTPTLVLSSADGGEARATIDELAVAHVSETPAAEALPPFRIDVAETPDAMKRDWKLVFEDEFEGLAGQPPNADKWFVPGWHKKHGDHAALDGNGHLAVKCDWERDAAGNATSNLVSTSIWSRDSWRYGYFEARLRFTRNNGWWSAFWLYGESNFNPFECGAEIDVFEDYYTRYPERNRGPKSVIALDHNLHVNLGPTTKSYNHNSAAEGSLDDFHVIGCKWTPFEISLYLDGKLLRSTSKEIPYPTVTFDPFRSHLISAPLHAIVSGLIFRSWGPRDTTGFTFPEFFLVDSVRVWAMPAADAPKVTWKTRPQGGFVPDGETLEFEVEVKSARKIKAAYLFDDGAFIACRTEPPWRFSLPFSKERYESTRWMKPGRQKRVPEWTRMTHSFDVFAQDEAGEVGSSDSRVRVVSAPNPVPSAVAQKIPGHVKATQFDDDSGRGVSWFTLRQNQKPQKSGDFVGQRHTGEWFSCTVEAERGGEYEGRLEFGPCDSETSHVDVLVDGERQTTVVCPSRRDHNWRRTKAEPMTLKIPAGKHVLTFLPAGYVSVGGVDLKLKD